MTSGLSRLIVVTADYELSRSMSCVKIDFLGLSTSFLNLLLLSTTAIGSFWTSFILQLF